MNLLIDAHVFDGKFQGTRTYLEGLYTHLTHHQDIEFFFAAHDVDALKKVFGEEDNIHYIHLVSESRLIRLALEFPNIIRKYRIDYAHFQYISPLFKSCKEIVTVHDLLFLDFPQFFPSIYKIKNKILFKRSTKRADILLSVSQFSKEEIVRHFGIPQKDIHLTYNSILPVTDSIGAIDLKQEYGLDKFILTVSRIEPRKNHLSLLKAFVDLNLSDEGYKLVMVGAKDLQYTEFFDYYNMLGDGIKNNILFLQVPFNHLVALYRQCSLFVFPSYAEGFGIPPIEAIAYGAPLLCSNATAMAEFGLPEDISFNPEDYDELKQKMIIQLNHPMDNSTYSEKVLSKYDWRMIADNYYEVLKSRIN